MSIPFIVNSQTFIIESATFSYYLKYRYGFKGYLDYWLTMVVTIDLSYMPERLRYIIHKSIDLKYRQDQNEGTIILQDESNAQKIKSRDLKGEGKTPYRISSSRKILKSRMRLLS